MKRTTRMRESEGTNAPSWANGQASSQALHAVHFSTSMVGVSILAPSGLLLSGSQAAKNSVMAAVGLQRVATSFAADLEQERHLHNSLAHALGSSYGDLCVCFPFLEQPP
jgi:hypothetical protein